MHCLLYIDPVAFWNFLRATEKHLTRGIPLMLVRSGKDPFLAWLWHKQTGSWCSLCTMDHGLIHMPSWPCRISWRELCHSKEHNDLQTRQGLYRGPTEEHGSFQFWKLFLTETVCMLQSTSSKFCCPSRQQHKTSASLTDHVNFIISTLQCNRFLGFRTYK